MAILLSMDILTQPVQHTFIKLSRGILNILARIFGFPEAIGQEFVQLGKILPRNRLIVKCFRKRSMIRKPGFATAEDSLSAKRKRRAIA